MKKSLLALLALCMAAMLVLSSCTIPFLNMELEDLLAQVGIGGEKEPDDQKPVVDTEPEDEQEPPEEVGDPIEIPKAKGQADSNTYSASFPLQTYEWAKGQTSGLKGLQILVGNTLTFRFYAVPDKPVTGKPSVMTFTCSNKTGVAYASTDEVCATLGTGVNCYDYAAVPFSYVGKNASLRINLANTKDLAVAGTYCYSSTVTIDELLENYLNQPAFDGALGWTSSSANGGYGVQLTKHYDDTVSLRLYAVAPKIEANYTDSFVRLTYEGQAEDKILVTGVTDIASETYTKTINDKRDTGKLGKVTVCCYEYAIPVSVLAKQTTFTFEFVETKLDENNETVEKIQLSVPYVVDALENFPKDDADADLIEAMKLLTQYGKALNAYNTAMADVKKFDKKLVNKYVDLYTTYANDLAKYERGALAEKPVAPAYLPMPSVIPLETVNTDIEASVVEGFTLPEANKVFEITPSFRNVSRLKNYIAGVYVDFTGSYPVLVFRLGLEDTVNVDVRLNDYHISDRNLARMKETASASVDGATQMKAAVEKAGLLEVDEDSEFAFYLVKTDALTIKTFDKVYTLTIYDEVNNTIESLSYSAADYIRAFAAGRTLSEDVMAKIAVDEVVTKESEESGTSEGSADIYERDENGDKIPLTDENGNIVYQTDDEGNFIYEKVKDAKGNYKTNEDGSFVYKTDADGNPVKIKLYKLKEQYEVQTEIVTYQYPTEADTVLGDLLCAWYALTESAYLMK